MITIKEVEHVARLARLELSEDEKIKFSKQLGDILDYVNQLNEVNTENVEPMEHALPIYNVMREDEVKVEFTRGELLANAPEEENGFFRVPKI